MRLDGRRTLWLGAATALLVILTGVSRGEDREESRQTHPEERRVCGEVSRGQAQPGQESARSEEGQKPAPSGADPAPPGAAGIRVFLDPQTGRMIPPDQLPPEALSAFEQAMLRRDSAGLIQHSLPSGAVVVDLQGRFHSFAVATIDPEAGVSTTRCVTSAEAAQSLLDARAKQGPGQQASRDE